MARLLSPSLLAPLAVVLASLIQFRAVLLGRVYRFEDISAYFEPRWTAEARAMAAGWPAIASGGWDGGAWSGQPLFGDPQGGFFYPPNWLWLVMPVLRAYAVSALLHSMWAGLGMYALCRGRGRSWAAAAAGGIALGIGGFVVLQTRHLMFVQATAWIPWVAFFGLRLVRSGKADWSRAWLAATAAATGMLLLTGGVSMIYYGAWFLFAVLLPAAFIRDAALHKSVRRLFALQLAALLGIALAACALLPALAHGRISPRALGTEYDFAASVSWSGLHLIPSLFLPNLLGQDVRGNYAGGGTQWEIAGYYGSLLGFGLAMYALFAGPRGRRAERIALGSIFVLALLLAPGAHSPIHRLAFRLLPLYDAMRCPARALYVFSLAVPMLAADGIDLLVQRSKSMLQRIILVLLPLLIAVDLLVAHRAENPSITVAEARAQAFPEAATFLATEARGDRYINDVHLPHALHNSGLLFGSESAGGYSSLPIWRYLHLLWIANHERPYPFEKLHDDLAAQGIWRFDSPVVDVLSIRWVLAPKNWNPYATGYRRRFTGRDGIDVWENTEALPRAWMLPEARVPLDVEPGDVLAAMQHQRTARVEPVEAERSSFGRVLATVDAAGPRMLVLSEPAHPGWRATVDGMPAKVETVDYAIIGVAVPAGRHTVEVKMTSKETVWGLFATLAAALCIAAIALSSRWARRDRGRF